MAIARRYRLNASANRSQGDLGIYYRFYHRSSRYLYCAGYYLKNVTFESETCDDIRILSVTILAKNWGIFLGVIYFL